MGGVRAAQAGAGPLIIGAGQATGVIVTRDGKRPRTLRVETWKKILRLQREVRAEGWKATFSCPECRQSITMTAPHPTSPELACACTVWIGR